MSRRSKSNFYLGFLLLPAEKRRAMEVLYAFMRHTDDLADAPLHLDERTNDRIDTVDLRRENLRIWREALKNALNNENPQVTNLSFADSDKRILPALADIVRKYQIPAESLFAVIDGVEMDLDRIRYETFDELRIYCEHVASAVGLACIHIWGFDRSKSAENDIVFDIARRAGIALQLTNILRDIKNDAVMDRIYLPLKDITAFGYSVEELKTGVINEAFKKFMEMQIHRTQVFYRDGFKLMDYLHYDGRRIFGLMISTYHALLREIVTDSTVVFSKTVRVWKPHAAFLAAAWTFCPDHMFRRLQKELQV
jgi:15-cis-phytoene synthase